MTKHILRRMTALALAAMFVLGGFASVFAAGFEGYPQLDHRPLSEEDLQYRGWDSAVLDALLKRIEKMDADTPGSEFWEVYDEIIAELDALYDQYVLADAAYYANVNDDRAADDYNAMYEALTDAQDAFFLCMQRVLHGPKGRMLRMRLNSLWIAWIETYEEDSDALDELHRQENDLVQQYYAAELQTGHIASYGEQVKAKNDLCGPIYLELVQVRDEIARQNGFDNYYEYAFASYGRDYEPEDIEMISEFAKERLVPLYLEIYELWYDSDYPQSIENFNSQEDVLDVIEWGIRNVHPGLNEAFDYLRSEKPYDLEYTPSKAPVGYTDNLPGHHCAFIFNCPYETYQDYSDLIHEFGHFNAAFHDSTPSIYLTSILDVAEIHSQGLELLVTRYADEMYGDEASFMTLDVIFRMLDSVLSGCMYDEFQKTIYENPDMTLAEINNLAGKLARAYGVDGSGYEKYEWVDISHTFDMPLYYISYATSALSSLDIWRLSLADYDMAADLYMQVTALDSSMGYMEAVLQCGLTDFTERAALEVLADDIEQWFNEQYYGNYSWDVDLFDLEGDVLEEVGHFFEGKGGLMKDIATNFLWAILAITSIGIIVFAVLILFLWGRHKGEEITNQTPANPGYTEDPSGISSFYAEVKPNTHSMSAEEEPAGMNYSREQALPEVQDVSAEEEELPYL